MKSLMLLYFSIFLIFWVAWPISAIETVFLSFFFTSKGTFISDDYCLPLNFVGFSKSTGYLGSVLMTLMH